ncbi:MAG TPA: hypothetical protein VHU19_00605 [Pyrinomonadaceae bacterium]|jgi:anti-sigma-K factor RskA|nr:hypothetical protein [Pyrinomonadaceae bacterium]
MKDEHIKAILESGAFAALREGELAAMRAHTARCEECRRAFEAARISSLLVRERAAEAFEPPPFFQTRVLAALRERQAEGEAWSFGRLWKAAGALVSSMAATVALLAALTFVVPGQQPAVAQELNTADNAYSPETVILNQTGPAGEQMSYGQVLTTLYGPDDNTAR